MIKKEFKMELAKSLNRLGTETAFSVLAEAKIRSSRQPNDTLRSRSTRF